MNVQEYCATEGARVFAAIYRSIKEHTLVLDEVAEGLAGAAANAHTEVVAAILRERGRHDRPEDSLVTTPAREEVAIHTRSV